MLQHLIFAHESVSHTLLQQSSVAETVGQFTVQKPVLIRVELMVIKTTSIKQRNIHIIFIYMKVYE